MTHPGISGLVSDALFRQPSLVRFLPTANADGRLVLFAAESSGTNPAPKALRRIGSERFVPLPGWYGVSICLGGSGTLRPIGGMPTEVTSGALIRFTDRPYGPVWRRLDGLRELVACIDVGTGRALADLGLWPPGDAVVNGCASAALVRAFLRLVAEAEDASMATSELMRRLVDMLMLTWSSMEASGDAAFAAQARNLLSENLAVGAAIPAMATRLGMSERQFRRRFHHATGLSPNAYRNQLRLERACRLLASMPVARVAAELGYTDGAAFSRQFSAAMGMPPSRLRDGRTPKSIAGTR
jgi:AraC-like DNA-binding protein